MMTATTSKMRAVTCGWLVGIAQLLPPAWGRVFQLSDFRLQATGGVHSNISRRHSSPLTHLSNLEELAKEITGLYVYKPSAECAWA